MRNFAFVIATAAALVVGPALQARERLTPEQKLAELLVGREAGTAVDCINLSETSDVQVIDKTAVVYGSGRVIYVNRPRNPDDLNSDDILVTKLHIAQLCKLDVVQLRGRTSHTFSGFVTLENFVPYHRVARKE